ncbi:MAG: branched-chain amino acid transport system permease protein [Chloroflexota bacterium]|nr:branched-chain amino acid transport system permease protein [Chloroflexota bacterium]
MRERFHRIVRERVRGLLSDELVAEHAARPLGPHSDGLARVLIFMRGADVEGKEVLLSVETDRRWRIARITRGDKTRPLLLEGEEFTSWEDALHAIFLQRVEALRGG